MAVKLRLHRMGRKNRDFWRLAAIDSRTKRDGKPIEELGFYDPLLPDETKQVSIKVERVQYWLSVGAEPSATVVSLLKRAGVPVKEPKKGSRPPKQRLKRTEAKKLAAAAAAAAG